MCWKVNTEGEIVPIASANVHSRNQQGRVLCITEEILDRTKFQYRTLSAGNMEHHTATERAISEMRNLILRHKKGIIAEDIDEEARIQAENLSSVVGQLKSRLV